MPNEPLALARAAARRVLSRSPFSSGPRQARAITPPIEPVAVERIDAAPRPPGRVDLRPAYGPRIDTTEPRQAPGVKPGARVEGLRPEMTRIYGDVSDAWAAAGAPAPVITSGNDSRHMRGSRHYEDLAFDLRGNNIDAATAARIRDDLGRRIGGDYQVFYETFPRNPSNNHIHVEYDPPPPRR
jgi:hypothetical protein